MSTNVRGRVYVRLANGGIGETLAGARLTFMREDGSASHDVTTNNEGAYSITLPQARYYLRTTHPDYSDYTTAPGFIVVPAEDQICNCFLLEPRVTTAIIVRHAEKLNPSSTSPEEPLSDDGHRRAEALGRILFRAGVTAIYATNTVRALSTAEPLSKALMLPTQVYSAPSAVAASVLNSHEGDVALIVAHSNTVREIITAFGATIDVGMVSDDDYDNMFVVSRSGTSVNVLNLQYAADTGPGLAKNSAAALNLLLVGTGNALGSFGRAPQRLLHAAHGASVKAIYVHDHQDAMVKPLATHLGLTPINYSNRGLLSLLARIRMENPTGTVVVSGPNAELRAIVKHLQGEIPILYTTDTDNLVLLTRFTTGSVRVVPMRL